MKAALSLLALCATALPALANQAACTADLRALATNITPESLAALDPISEDGFCVLRDVEIVEPASGSFQSVNRAQEIRWRAIWADESRPFPPQGMVLDVKGAVRAMRMTDAPEYEYSQRLLSELQENHLHLDYAIDPQAKVLVLRALSTVMDGNHVDLSGRVENFDTTALTGATPQVDKLTAYRLTKLDLTFTNANAFEMAALGWIHAIYPTFGETPEAAVDAVKAIAIDGIAKVPDYLTDQPSRDAATELVRTLPHPTGQLHLVVTAENGIAAQDLIPAFMLGQPTWDMLKQPLEGVRVSAEWQPKPAD